MWTMVDTILLPPRLGERKADVKNGAARTAFGRDLAFVRVDDRACDAQSHAHAVGLGGGERLEQASQLIRGYSGPGIADRDKSLAVRRPRPADDLTDPVRCARDGFDPVDHQVQNNLFQLDAISLDP